MNRICSSDVGGAWLLIPACRISDRAVLWRSALAQPLLTAQFAPDGSRFVLFLS
jgi:aryl-alcohol dehydrogenase-like predicted oxidoreductase